MRRGPARLPGGAALLRYGDRVLEPVGPLPASVYWRRRALALAAVLLVVLLLWAVWPGGDDGGARRDAAATTGTASATPGELTATAPPNDPGRAADPGSTAPSGPTTGGGTGTGGGAGTAAPATTPAATPKPPPPAPKPCPDAALQVRVAPAVPAYPAGTQPRIVLTVRNVSAAACTRDLGPGQQEVLLYRGTQRLWSSNDCYPEADRSVRTLEPGETATSSVTWSGLSSRPDCAGERTRVPAGTYELIGRLGAITTPRAKVTLT